MDAREQQLQQVLIAAKALLEARENQMITRVEWETLERAVNNASVNPNPSELARS